MLVSPRMNQSSSWMIERVWSFCCEQRETLLQIKRICQPKTESVPVPVRSALRWPWSRTWLIGERYCCMQDPLECRDSIAKGQPRMYRGLSRWQTSGRRGRSNGEARESCRWIICEKQSVEAPRTRDVEWKGYFPAFRWNLDRGALYGRSTQCPGWWTPLPRWSGFPNVPLPERLSRLSRGAGLNPVLRAFKLDE